MTETYKELEKRLATDVDSPEYILYWMEQLFFYGFTIEMFRPLQLCMVHYRWITPEGHSDERYVTDTFKTFPAAIKDELVKLQKGSLVDKIRDYCEEL